MICALTARRIADGKADEFIENFAGGSDEMPPEIRERFKAVYACRSVTDPNVILTFGLFKGTLDEFRAMQDSAPREEQMARIDPLVEDVLFDDSFEVVRELVSEMSGAAKA
jgi:hypothetical protein